MSEVYRDTLLNFLSPVKDELEDSSVSEIMINGPNQIYIERQGKLELTNKKFDDEDSLQAAVNNIAQSVGRRVSSLSPTLDARLPDGSRIHAVLPPSSRQGTVVSIRKFTQSNISFKDYVAGGAMTAFCAQFLDVCMYLGKNIIVSGGTGSGKTTLLRLLASRIPKGQRLIVIEDSSELSLTYEHVIQFETQMAGADGQGEVSMRDLLKSSLRLRPDRIIVGEVRSSEAMELIQAMNTGHKGCLGTIHANSPVDAIVRLEGLAMSADSKMSSKAIQHQIGSAIDLVVQISRISDGSRRITAVSEVLGADADGTYNVVPIFELQKLKREADGQFRGNVVPTGALPTFMDEIEANGIPLQRTRFSNRTQAA